MTRRPRAASVAAAVCLLTLLAGCGTRASEADVRAGAQPEGVVTLDQASVDALAVAAQAGVAAAAAPGGTTAALPVATTPGNTSPGSGATAGTGPTGSAATAKPRTSVATGTAADTGKCTTPGAPVTLGQVGTFSGLAGSITGDGLLAVAAWAKDVNARGGLACHPVTLYVRDDGGDPARAAAAVRELVDQRQVAALVANVTALSGAGFLPEVKKTCVPSVGLDFGPDWSREACLFPQGGGWFESIAALVKQAVDKKHLKLGLLYCVEISTCASAGKLVEEAAERYGAKLVYSSAVSLTQTDFTAQCQNAKNAGVEELAVALEGSAMARLARSCLALNYRPILVGAGLAVSVAQAEDPKLRELTVVAMAPNAPWFLTDQPGLKEYHGGDGPVRAAGHRERSHRADVGVGQAARSRGRPPRGIGPERAVDGATHTQGDEPRPRRDPGWAHRAPGLHPGPQGPAQQRLRLPRAADHSGLDRSDG